MNYFPVVAFSLGLFKTVVIRSSSKSVTPKDT